MKIGFFVLSFVFTTTALSATLEFEGFGVDGEVCKAVIDYNQDTNQLTSVHLTGATKDFEILAEKGSKYGPKSSISSRGADTILEMFQEDPKLYNKMSYKWSWLKHSEIYTLTTKDLLKDAPPSKEGEEPLKYISGEFELTLKYSKGGELIAVYAENSFKTFKFINLASRNFSCEFGP